MEPARLRASPEQFSALIEFMERNGDLSKPQAGAQGRLRSEQLWSQLSTLLNSIGGGVQKSQDKWKKVWSDWKTKTKKKYQLIRCLASGTGGGPSSRQFLTALEERVIAIIGVTAVAGQSGIQELGFGAPSQPSEPSRQPSQPEPQIVVEVPEVHSIPLNILSPPGPLAPIPRQARQATPPPRPLPPPPSPQPIASPPPTASPLRNWHQTPSSPSAAGTPRRRQPRARRNRGLTPFERATQEFVAVEQRRLRFEERRETMFNERETERLRLEALRIEATHDHNRLLQQLCVLAQDLVEAISQRSSSLPSTDILPDMD